MLKKTRELAMQAKEPFEFTWTKPSLDWYEDVHVSIKYDDYPFLRLERRFGPSWWLVGCTYNDKRNKWEDTTLGQIPQCDIPRLYEWARFEDPEYHTVSSILNEIKGYTASLDAIGEFLEIMRKHEKKEHISLL